MALSNYLPNSRISQAGVCTSSTRPVSPYEGFVIYETDTDRVLVYNNSAWVVVHGGGVSYQFVETIYYTSTGTHTFSKASYPWLRAVKVKCQGAGGGGAGTAANNGNSGGGGGGGAYSEIFITDIPNMSSSVTVTVGAAGTGGAAGDNNGTAGGSSSFGSYVVCGGGGAGVSPAGAYATNNGGTVTTSGDFNIPGQNGGPRAVSNAAGSQRGGQSFLGVVGNDHIRTSGNYSGLSGLGYGAGGNGGKSETTAQSGGNGAPGIVILELYC
jgi:hypothetical protein